MENIEAKTLKVCDSCRASLKDVDTDKGQQIEATLNNSQQKSQQYHFCNESCLLAFLKGRAKRKGSKAAVFTIKTDFRN